MSWIEIDAADGVAEAWAAGSAAGGEAPLAVVVIMDAFGVRPAVTDIADRIASWGFPAIAPNVFYRSGTVAETVPEGDLSDPERAGSAFGEARPRIDALTPAQIAADAGPYVEAARRISGGERVAVVGYCMGARVAVRTSGARPDDVVAVAGFHGGGLATDDPASPHRSFATARAAMLFRHADADRSMPPEAMATLEAAASERGLAFSQEVYPGSLHGFAMPDTAAYDPVHAARHLEELERFLWDVADGRIAPRP